MKISVSVLGEKSMNAKDRLKSKSEVTKKKVWSLKGGGGRKNKNVTNTWGLGVREYF